MINTILVPTDGSQQAQKAAALAADIASKYDATLILLHVLMQGPLPDALRQMAEVERLVEERAGAHPAVSNVPATLGAMMRGPNVGEAPEAVYGHLGERILAEAERLVREKGVSKVRLVTERGDPVTHILALADHEPADMVVMGSRGLSDLRGLVVGSVSHKVSHLAQCTVVTVK